MTDIEKTSPLKRQRFYYLLSLAAFTALLFALPRDFISPDLGGTILTITTFLFGLIAGFYIVVTTTDYNAIKSLLAQETAAWIILYRHISNYLPRRATQFSGLLDAFLRRAFDAEIIDYARATEEEFARITKFIGKLPFSAGRSDDYDNIRDSFAEVTKMRQQLLVLGARTLSSFQWIILFALAGLVVASLYGLRTGELFFDIVTVLISSSIVLILLLIRDLDLYVWNEGTFGFEIFQTVFKSIDQLPYYPEESLLKHRIQPKEVRYRIGSAARDRRGQRKITFYSFH